MAAINTANVTNIEPSINENKLDLLESFSDDEDFPKIEEKLKFVYVSSSSQLGYSDSHL